MTDLPAQHSLEDLLHHQAWLQNLAQAIAGRAEAADASQQTWLQALRTRSPLRDARAWLATVLTNAARQGRRADRRRLAREQQALSGRAMTAPAASDASERFEVQRAVTAAVHALAEPFRTVVLLHHFDHMPLAAIGRELGVPDGTVRWRLHRAHELLRQRLANELGETRWRGALALLVRPSRAAGLLVPAALLLVSLGGIAAVATAWLGGSAPSASETAAARSPSERVVQAPVAAVADGGATLDADRSDAGSAPAVDLQATVLARIVDGSGAPLPGATLRLTKASYGSFEAGAAEIDAFVSPAVADADGRVALPLRVPAWLLPPGTSTDGLVGAAVFVAAAAGFADHELPVYLGDGDVRQLGTLALHPVGRVVGRVVDGDGVPLAGARICAQQPPFPLSCEELTKAQRTPNVKPATDADNDGRFILDGVRCGPVLVWASHPGFAPGWQPLELLATEPATAALTLRAAPEVAATPATPAHTRVLVVDESGAPVAGATVAHRLRWLSGVATSTQSLTNREGATTMSTGSQSDGSPLVEATLWITPPTPTLACVEANAMTAAAGDLVVTLPPGSPIEALAKTADGAAVATFGMRFVPAAPAAGAWEVQGKDGAAAAPTPCTHGTFEFEAPGYAVATHAFSPSAPQRLLQVTLRVAQPIRGRVHSEGKPIANARVTVLQCHESMMINGFRSMVKPGNAAHTDRDGAFQIEAPAAGSLRLQVHSPDFAPTVTAERPYDPAIGWEPLAIELDRGGAIEGIVRNRSGAAVPRAVVAANDFYGSPRTTHADGAGRFRFSQLRAGDYEVHLADTMLDPRMVITWESKAGSPPQPTCTVLPGRTTQCDFEVDRCRLVVAVQASGFSTAGWRAWLQRAHDDNKNIAEATLGTDSTCALTTDSTGRHVLWLAAPGGPLGNVNVRIEVHLVAGEQRCDLPLTLAPFAGEATGRVPGGEPPYFHLRAERSGATITTSLQVDPATGAFAAPLAPVGDVALRQSDIEIGRCVVPAVR